MANNFPNNNAYLKFLLVISGWAFWGTHAYLYAVNPEWTFEKLLDTADLVVLAKANETKDVEGKIDLLDHGIDAELSQVSTKFTILVALKGKSDKNIDVRHYKYSAVRNPLILDGPSLVSFRSKGMPIQVFGKKLFLESYIPLIDFCDFWAIISKPSRR